MYICTLIKKKIKLSWYVRKFRGIGCKVIYDYRPPHIWWKYLCITSYIRKPFFIYDFAPDPMHLNFPIHEENFVFFFISVPVLNCNPSQLQKPLSIKHYAYPCSYVIISYCYHCYKCICITGKLFNYLRLTKRPSGICAHAVHIDFQIDNIHSYCPASSGKEKTKCDRIAPSHPLSWPCVSDLLTPTSKARADYAP